MPDVNEVLLFGKSLVITDLGMLFRQSLRHYIDGE